MPGGKWIPLMKRTVRDDSGAWLLLKKAPVRASETARSFAFTSTPKLPGAVAGAFGFRKTPSTLPSRSVTAMTMVVAGSAFAAVSMMSLTSPAVRNADPPVNVASAYGNARCARLLRHWLVSSGSPPGRTRNAKAVYTPARRTLGSVSVTRTWLDVEPGPRHAHASEGPARGRVYGLCVPGTTGRRPAGHEPVAEQSGAAGVPVRGGHVHRGVGVSHGRRRQRHHRDRGEGAAGHDHGHRRHGPGRQRARRLPEAERSRHGARQLRRARERERPGGFAGAHGRLLQQ